MRQPWHDMPTGWIIKAVFICILAVCVRTACEQLHLITLQCRIKPKATFLCRLCNTERLRSFWQIRD